MKSAKGDFSCDVPRLAWGSPEHALLAASGAIIVTPQPGRGLIKLTWKVCGPSTRWGVLPQPGTHKISSHIPHCFNTLDPTPLPSDTCITMAQEDVIVVSTSRKRRSPTSASASEARPHQCPQCDSAFIRIDHLNRHIKLRTELLE